MLLKNHVYVLMLKMEKSQHINEHELYMRRCFNLALNGLGKVSPNPMVGAVVVHENKIIGEGYHMHYGQSHAEVNAINAVKDKALLKDSVLYVNLEPCSHFGKTPPCADLIIEKGIPSVYVSCLDTNPIVSGKGIQKLKDAGVNVFTSICEAEGRLLNKRFFTYQEKKRPYIILKWAQTADSFIDKVRGDDAERTPTWISDEPSKILVHRWRTEEDAFLIGTNTVINDNPELTSRLWHGKNPVRIVLDKSLRIPKESKVFNADANTIIYNAVESEIRENLEFCKIDFSDSILTSVLKDLYVKKIQSVVVEGGASLLNSFISHNLWDEARIFSSEVVFGKGLQAPLISGKKTFEGKVGKCILKILEKD